MKQKLFHLYLVKTFLFNTSSMHLHLIFIWIFRVFSYLHVNFYVDITFWIAVSYMQHFDAKILNFFTLKNVEVWVFFAIVHSFILIWNIHEKLVVIFFSDIRIWTWLHIETSLLLNESIYRIPLLPSWIWMNGLVYRYVLWSIYLYCCWGYWSEAFSLIKFPISRPFWGRFLGSMISEPNQKPSKDKYQTQRFDGKIIVSRETNDMYNKFTILNVISIVFHFSICWQIVDYYFSFELDY